MKNIFYTAILLALLSCGENTPKKQKMTVEGYAQGTTYNIVYLSENGDDYQRSIDSTLIEIDNSLSTYQKRSIISKFNQSDSTLEVDQMFLDVYEVSKKVFEISEGAFDPTIAPIVNAWGFGFENLHSTDSATIDSLRSFVDFNKITLNDKMVIKERKGMMLDFNAVAQGYSVDVLANLLESRGINNYLVEVGGELKAKGFNSSDTLWRIGIDRPIEDLKERELEAIVNLDNKSLATSGNYRKFYEKDGMKYSHTINPKTGYPVEHNLLSATVITDNCSEADAFATVFMVVGLQEAKKIISTSKNLEGLLIYSDENGDLQTFMSDGLKECIELNADKN